MWKTVLAVTVAALVSGSGLVLAREMSDREDGPHWQPSAEDMKAFTDARVAALKAGLELKPEQEKNWPAVEAAIRDMAKARADRIAARADEQTGLGAHRGKHHLLIRAARDERRDPPERGLLLDQSAQLVSSLDVGDLDLQ